MPKMAHCEEQHARIAAGEAGEGKRERGKQEMGAAAADVKHASLLAGGVKFAPDGQRAASGGERALKASHVTYFGLRWHL